MPQGFVIARLDEAGKPVAFFKDSSFVEDINGADFFNDKTAARYEYGRAIASQPQDEYAVLPASMTIVLS